MICILRTTNNDSTQVECSRSDTGVRHCQNIIFNKISDIIIVIDNTRDYSKNCASFESIRRLLLQILMVITVTANVVVIMITASMIVRL